MIAILPAGEAERDALAAKAGFSGAEGTACLTASDGAERLGCILYRLSGRDGGSRERENGGKRAELLFLQAADPRLAGGLLRAALNAALDAGARIAVCQESAMVPFLEPLGFRAAESGDSGERVYAAVIREIFNKGCSGGCGH